MDYSNLWKLLIDKRLNRSQLKDIAHISTNAVAKLGKNESVSLDTLEKICVALSCHIEDVVTFIPTATVDNTSETSLKLDKAGTFSLNKGEPIHRWYSYVEGYSSVLVVSEIDKLLNEKKQVRTIYDPFSGTGTTNLVAASKGVESFYSESNPFMRAVIDTKINAVLAFNARYSVNALRHYIRLVQRASLTYHREWDGFEKFFCQPQLSQLLTIKEIICGETDPTIYSLLMLALSSIVVRASKMVRRGDLRYATKKEYHPVDVNQAFIFKLTDMIEDIDTWGMNIRCGTVHVSNDARENDYKDTFDCVITSPPYLNGTNYIRNTKLELKLNDLIQKEEDLPLLHSQGVTSGINNVSKRNSFTTILPEVKPYIEELSDSAYDRRIPQMVKGYFSDMNQVFSRLQQSMRNGGTLVMDIGDSQFGGVHIPTHEILSKLCCNQGFFIYSNETLRKRRSKNGMVLSQRLLRFRLEK